MYICFSRRLGDIGQVIRTGTEIFGCDIVSNHVECDHDGLGWLVPILGNDGCIYWPPYNANRILMYDPDINETSLVGDDFGYGTTMWDSGTLASGGIIYCIPDNASQVLSIDRFNEFITNLKVDMDLHPDKLGLPFVKNKKSKIDKV